MRLRSEWDREIVRLAVPALGALIAEPVYVLSDTAIVGHLGTPQLAGLAVAAAILVTGYSIFIFLAYGTTAAVARLIGAGDQREATHQAVQGVWLAVAVSRAGARWPGWCSPARWCACSARPAPPPATPRRTCGSARSACRRSWRRTRRSAGCAGGRTPGPRCWSRSSRPRSTWCSRSCSSSASGTGWARRRRRPCSCSGRAVAVYLLGLGRQAAVLRVGLRPVGRAVGRLARVGLDLLVRTVALRLALTSATAVAARLGPAQVGAHQIAFELWNTLALALDAIAIAAQALVGRLLGAGDAAAARAATRRMIELGLVFGVAVGLVLLAAAGRAAARLHRRPAGRAAGLVRAAVRRRCCSRSTRWCSCWTGCSWAPATCATWPCRWSIVGGAVPAAGRGPGRHRRRAGLAVDGDRRADAAPGWPPWSPACVRTPGWSPARSGETAPWT